jgi:hypothetical protein
MGRLVLIVDSPEAQRLVATWASAWERYADLLDETQEELVKQITEHFASAWSRISRVDIDDVTQLLPVLFENEILMADGQVSPVARAYIDSRMLAAMEKPK